VVIVHRTTNRRTTDQRTGRIIGCRTAGLTSGRRPHSIAMLRVHRRTLNVRARLDRGIRCSISVDPTVVAPIILVRSGRRRFLDGRPTNSRTDLAGFTIRHRSVLLAG
jgi:hypothetical protein